MRKVLGILMIIALLPLSSCSNNKVDNTDTYFYFGQSNSWLATYSITKVKSLYYDSLSIQYLFDVDNINKTEKIGPIEYKLAGNSKETASSYPQELQGNANFHTGDIINADAFKITFNKEMELTIKWQDKSETIKLKKQN